VQEAAPAGPSPAVRRRLATSRTATPRTAARRPRAAPRTRTARRRPRRPRARPRPRRPGRARPRPARLSRRPARRRRSKTRWRPGKAGGGGVARPGGRVAAGVCARPAPTANTTFWRRIRARPRVRVTARAQRSERTVKRARRAP
jgi:hypothetical protein